MLFWTIVLTSIITLFIYYYWKRENLFEKQKLPHVKPLPLVGNMGKALFRFQPIAHSIQDVYNLNKDAKYVGYFDFGQPVYMIRDPDLVKSISVKNFDYFVNHRGFADSDIDPLFAKNLFSLHDDQWRKLRNLLTPAFTSSKMKGMFKLMMNCGENFANYFVEEAKSTDSISIFSKDAFTRYTNDVIATCAFGITIDSMRNPKNDFYVLGRKSTNFDGIMALKFFLVRSFKWLAKIFRIKLIDSDAQEFFYKLVKDTIKMRDETGFSRPDMIQLMMETRNNKSGPQLSIEDMTSQAFIFFLGGFDTTSAFMCFVAHEISVNPEIQTKLQKEVDQVYEKYNGDVPYDVLNGMEYLDAVINETSRMYPIAIFLDRVCTKSFELPSSLSNLNPITLKPGDNVWFPVYPFHRDPEYFFEPDKFLPERFIDDPKLVNSPVYLPFGVGPRMCIGNRFALLETKVLLFHLLAKCSLKPGKKMKLPLELSKSSLSMTAQGGFWLELSPRNKWQPQITLKN